MQINLEIHADDINNQSFALCVKEECLNQHVIRVAEYTKANQRELTSHMYINTGCINSRI